MKARNILEQLAEVQSEAGGATYDIDAAIELISEAVDSVAGQIIIHDNEGNMISFDQLIHKMEQMAETAPRNDYITITVQNGTKWPDQVASIYRVDAEGMFHLYVNN